jgi:hypothetical protein
MLLCCSVLQTCDGCRARLQQMCSKQLACHHWCYGARGSSACLPCLQEGCQQQVGMLNPLAMQRLVFRPS